MKKIKWSSLFPPEGSHIIFIFFRKKEKNKKMKLGFGKKEREKGEGLPSDIELLRDGPIHVPRFLF